MFSTTEYCAGLLFRQFVKSTHSVKSGLQRMHVFLSIEILLCIFSVHFCIELNDTGLDTTYMNRRCVYIHVFFIRNLAQDLVLKVS